MADRAKLEHGRGPGTWARMGRRVFVTCAKCGTTAQLHHEVDDLGNVTPGLVCPNDCGWHVWAKLEGWKP